MSIEEEIKEFTRLYPLLPPEYKAYVKAILMGGEKHE